MSHNPYPSSSITDTTSTIHISSPRTSSDDLICPLSPTSSLKGIYVRSRPTSTEIPESLGFDFGGFYQAAFNRTVQQSTERPSHGQFLSTSTVSDENEPTFTPPTISSESSHVSSAATSIYVDEEYIQKKAARRTAETSARVKALNEGHARARKNYASSLKATASTNSVTTLGLGANFNTGYGRSTHNNIEEEDEASTSAPEVKQDQARSRKTSSIPLVYRAISKKVYGVFHRKAHSTPESIQVDPLFFDKPVNAPTQEPKPVQAIRPSSISLFTRKRCPTIDSQKQTPRTRNNFSQRAISIRRNKISFPATPNTVSLTSTSLAIENRARLRRSVSFAAFVDFPELDDHLDEATAEATQIATKATVMVRWANMSDRQGGDSDGISNGYIFERHVE